MPPGSHALCAPDQILCGEMSYGDVAALVTPAVALLPAWVAG